MPQRVMLLIGQLLIQKIEHKWREEFSKFHLHFGFCNVKPANGHVDYQHLLYESWSRIISTSELRCKTLVFKHDGFFQTRWLQMMYPKASALAEKIDPFFQGNNSPSWTGVFWNLGEFSRNWNVASPQLKCWGNMFVAVIKSSKHVGLSPCFIFLFALGIYLMEFEVYWYFSLLQPWCGV